MNNFLNVPEIQQDQENYRIYREDKLNKQHKFINSLKLINKKTNTPIKINFDIDKKRNSDYIYFKLASEYLSSFTFCYKWIMSF